MSNLRKMGFGVEKQALTSPVAVFVVVMMKLSWSSNSINDDRPVHPAKTSMARVPCCCFHNEEEANLLDDNHMKEG